MTSGIQTPIPPLADKKRRWLEDLHGQIWREGEWCGFGTVPTTAARALRRREWTRVKDLIRGHGLLCEMSSDFRGHLSVLVYTRPLGTREKPRKLITVHQQHLPGFRKISGEYDKRLDAAWKALSPFTHSDRNKELLEIYGLEPSREKSRYEY